MKDTMTETLRRKLRFRAGHRGFREMDMFMEAFAEAHLATMSAGELQAFEAILDLPDQDVYSWITGQTSPPAEVRTAMLDAVLAFRYPALPGRT
jgi:antitoxin CptB